MTDLTPAQKIRAETKEATRRALLEAGVAETVDRGGEIPSIDAVVARAGYTRGAFYFYFDDRDHFVAEMLDWVLSDILQQLFLSTAADAADLAEVIERFNATLTAGDFPEVRGDIRSAYLAVLRELGPDSALRERHTGLMETVISAIEEMIRAGQEAESIRKDADPRATATFLVLSAIGSIMWSGIGIDIDNEAVGQATLKLLKPRG